MSRSAWLGLAGLFTLLLLAAAPAAHAQTGGSDVSYSIWTVDGTTVRLRFMLPTSEVKALAARGQPAPDTPAVAQMVSNQLSVTTPGGDCSAIDQGEGVGQIYTLALTPGLDRFEVIFECPQADGLVLHDGLLFDHDPNHVNYAEVRVAGGKPVLRMFTRKQQTLALPTGAAKLADAPVEQHAEQGLMSLVTRIDRLCMVAGLLLLARRWRDLAMIAGSLTLGYGASVAVALCGQVTSGAGVTEALIGLLILLLLGLNSLRTTTAQSTLGGRSGWIVAAVGAVLVAATALVAWRFKDLSTALTVGGVGLFGLAQLSLATERGLGWLVWTPVALFGLLDGMGPANDLAILQPPTAQLAPVLIGHDLGAGAAATGLVAVAMGGLWLFRRWLRPLQNIVGDLVQAGFVGLGLFWFVSRLYS